MSVLLAHGVLVRLVVGYACSWPEHLYIQAQGLRDLYWKNRNKEKKGHDTRRWLSIFLCTCSWYFDVIVPMGKFQHMTFLLLIPSDHYLILLVTSSPTAGEVCTRWL